MRSAGLGMLGAGMPNIGGGGGSANLDGMMQAMQNPAMQQVVQQLMAQPGFMEARTGSAEGPKCRHACATLGQLQGFATAWDAHLAYFGS